MTSQKKFSQEIFLIEIKLKIAIIGGGINGLFTSWELSKIKHFSVDLFESDKVMSKTSASSSKMLHGGIRYLEKGHISLVRKSLLDRHWWLTNAPEHCKTFEMVIPVYRNGRRSGIVLYIGALIYMLLAGKYSLGSTKWISRNEILNEQELQNDNLKSAISFFDLQMNEELLGKWVKDNAILSGVKIFEDTPINSFNINGELTMPDGVQKKYDYVINASGPWAAELNKKNNIKTKYDLDLVRGSHLIINTNVKRYYLMEESDGERIVFIMPYQGKTLIGTTEVKQDLNEEIKCSNEEQDYLVGIYNKFFINKISKNDIYKTFSGLRPIVNKKNKKSKISLSSSSREMAISKKGKLISLYGGKWTSAPSTARKIVKYIK